MSTSAKNPASVSASGYSDSQVSPDTARARFAYVDARSLSDCSHMAGEARTSPGLHGRHERAA